MSSDLIIVSQVFYPELVSVSLLLTELAEDMAKKGKRVEVIAGQMTYYGRERVDSEIHYRGVRITRVWNTQFDKNHLLGRISNNLTFVLSMLIRLPSMARGRTVLVATVPPLLPFLGILSKIFGRPRVCVLLYDVFPDLAVALGYLKEGGMMARLLEGVMVAVYRRADALIVLGRDMREIIAKKISPALHHKLKIIGTWSDSKGISVTSKQESHLAKTERLSDSFVVQYSGNMGLVHDLEFLIHAAKSLENDKIVFLLIGDGGQRKKLEQLVRALHVTNVRFVAFQPMDKLSDSLSCADVSVVTLSARAKGLSVPSKLYGILASGRPTLAVVPHDSEVAYIVSERDCGLVVPPNDALAFIDAVKSLKNDPARRARMGINARRAFEKEFDREIVTSKFEHVLWEDGGTA